MHDARPTQAPPWLTGAALVLWGASIGLLPLGLALGLACEGLRLLPRREERAAAKADAMAILAVRAWGGAVLGVLAMAVVLRGLPEALYLWLRWLPAVSAPLLGVAAFMGGLRVHHFTLAVRPSLVVEGAGRRVDLPVLLAAVALAAAGTGTAAPGWLYPALALLVAWAVLARAPAGARRPAAAMLVLAALLGQGLHTGIHHLQGRVEDWSTDFIAQLLAGKSDPFRERTRIGDVGKVKLGDRITMRVQTPRPLVAPLLLREAAFDRYASGEWQATRRTFQPVAHEGDRWLLGSDAAAAHIVVRRSFADGEGLLPLPLGSQQLARLRPRAIDRLASGAVRVRGLAGPAVFQVAFDEAAQRDAPDPAREQQVPASLAPLLADLVQREGLRRPSAAETVMAVDAFFARGFTYSLDLGTVRDGTPARGIPEFLLRDRSGHCEFFATATVLLLRQAGVPARYVGGYAVQEFSDLEQAYVVRARHAHAWAEAFVDGRWRAVDTTPAGWVASEEDAARGPLSPLLDVLSWLWAREWFGPWRAGPLLPIALAAVAAAALVAAVRLWRRRERRPRPPARSEVAAAWLRVERQLTLAGHPRLAGETVREWAVRLRAQHPEASWPADLQALAQAYYTSIFDPGVPRETLQGFLAAAAAWHLPETKAP
jgi:hypothetical protein